jgi:hypothetical protein
MVNPTPLRQRQPGFRLPLGEWFNDIIDRVNGLVAGTLTGSWAGTFNGAMGGTTPAAASVTDLSQNGIVVRIPQILAAAGATQGNAGAITKSTVIVTVTASTQGVKLPTAATGKEVRVHCPGTVGVKVYPNTSDKIDAGATNAAQALVAGKANIYQARDAVTWVTLKGA